MSNADFDLIVIGAGPLASTVVEEALNLFARNSE